MLWFVVFARTDPRIAKRISRPPAVPFLRILAFHPRPVLGVAERSPNSHEITSFAAPPPHNLSRIISFQNGTGVGVGNRFRAISAHCNSFRCNTYGPPRKCCKQKTYELVNSFRCNTYKKPGVPPLLLYLSVSILRRWDLFSITALPPSLVLSFGEKPKTNNS